MTIGKRFIDLARAELNSLLDYASRRGGGDDDENFGSADGESLSGFSREELEQELARRRSAHAEVEEAIHGRRGPWDATNPRADAAGPTPSAKATRPRRSAPSATAGGATAGSTTNRTPSTVVDRAYATLEVPVGSSFETVRTSYRKLMRTYHPDHHTSSPEKQRAANEVAQRLTEAYKLLQKRLDRG